MKIGIISDSHDRIDNLNKALKLLEKNNVKVLIHCGDFCAPFIIEELAKFKGEVHCVFGNINDKYNSLKFAQKTGVNLYGDIAELSFEERKIAITHLPFFAQGLASTRRYDAVFYGHTHIASKEKINNTLFLNPGEIMGRKGKITLAIYNTETNDGEILQIE